jgi:hypothetical protein
LKVTIKTFISEFKLEFNRLATKFASDINAIDDEITNVEILLSQELNEHETLKMECEKRAEELNSIINQFMTNLPNIIILTAVSKHSQQ